MTIGFLPFPALVGLLMVIVCLLVAVGVLFGKVRRERRKLLNGHVQERGRRPRRQSTPPPPPHLMN